ncbi:location of vulva defective 1-like [Alosa alosa]|uniref:location of vulva defective 1-like n=1 Tax=Alosa alosa TaxID=278164 RepID=UPI0020154FC7|nr:location of vulva defective 1-like [Alosa alosa]
MTLQKSNLPKWSDVGTATTTAATTCETTVTSTTTSILTSTTTVTSTAISTLTSTTKIPAKTKYPSSSVSDPAVSTSLRDYQTQPAKDSFTFGPWLSLPAVALVVGLFLVVLTASCLCSKRHKHTRSQNATYWRSDSIRFGPNEIKQPNTGGDGSLLGLSEISGSDLKKDSEQDVSNPCHVYSTIPDTLDVSTQQNPTYSLAQAERDPHTSQQGPTYSLAQAGRDPHTTQQNPTYSLAQAGRDPHTSQQGMTYSFLQ